MSGLLIRKEACEDGGRDWSYAGTIHGRPLATRSLKRPGKVFPQSLQREGGPEGTLISDFRPPDL